MTKKSQSSLDEQASGILKLPCAGTGAGAGARGVAGAGVSAVVVAS